jgi:glucokinase
MTILPGGPLCGCGKRGHLEAVSSGTGIAHWVSEQLASGANSRMPKEPPPTARQIAAAASAGDALALAAFERAGYYLGLCVANYLHIFNPSVIIFGGGVARAGEMLFAPMRKAMEEAAMSPQYLKELIFEPAALGDEAGLMGALALARSHHQD